ERSHETGDRGDGDDAAVAAPGHVAGGRLRAIETPEEVSPEVIFPVLRSDLEEGLRLGDAGVVDEHVDLAERADRVGHEPLDRGMLPDVAGRSERAPSEAARLAGGLFRALAVEIGDRDVRSFAGERESDRLADAAAGSGDECDLTLESHVASFRVQASWRGRRSMTRAPRRAATSRSIVSTIVGIDVPGPKTAAVPNARISAASLSGIVPPTTIAASRPFSRASSQTRRVRWTCAPER